MRPVDHPSAAAALGAPNAGGLPLRAASRLVPTTASYGQRRISRECGILYRQRAEIERGSPWRGDDLGQLARSAESCTFGRRLV